jgi:hypothetical protein
VRTWTVDPLPLVGGLMGSDKYDLDLGHEHYLQFTHWRPKEAPGTILPEYANEPDQDKIGAIIYHKCKDGKTMPDGSREWCSSGIWFDCPIVLKFFPGKTPWKVEQWEPLTVSPSILCLSCGDHGHIKSGKWEPC